MEDKDRLQVIFMILVILTLGILIVITIKLKDIYKRINILEKDYKIYELNLKNLEKNKEIQFKR